MKLTIEIMSITKLTILKSYFFENKFSESFKINNGIKVVDIISEQ